MKGIACAVLFAFVLTACGSLPKPPPTYHYQSVYNIDVYGAFNEEQGKKIDELISVLPHEIIHSVRWIFVDPKECLNETENCKIVGLFNPSDEVRVSHLYVNHKNVLIHEFAHAYHHHLDLRFSDFTPAWIAIAGEVYGKNVAQPIAGYPSDGVLTKYGSTNYREDVAVFTAAIYDSLNRPNYNLFTWELRFGTEKLNPKYLKKTKLLYEYGFLSRADYEKFLSLNYFPE